MFFAFAQKNEKVFDTKQTIYFTWLKPPAPGSPSRLYSIIIVLLLLCYKLTLAARLHLSLTCYFQLFYKSGLALNLLREPPGSDDEQLLSENPIDYWYSMKSQVVHIQRNDVLNCLTHIIDESYYTKYFLNLDKWVMREDRTEAKVGELGTIMLKFYKKLQINMKLTCSRSSILIESRKSFLTTCSEAAIFCTIPYNYTNVLV